MGGKKVSGRERHLLVDTLGLIWGLAVLPAAPTDWDGAVEVFRRIGDGLPRLAKVWADAADRVDALCVKCRNWHGERGRHGRQRLVYAVWGLEPATVDWVRPVYRTRFGIETSYRQMNQAKVTTTTRNPVVRLFLVGVALILRNVWVWLHWEQLSMPRRGGRVVRLDRLPFKTLLLWLLHVAEEQFGRWDMTSTERPPLQPHAT